MSEFSFDGLFDSQEKSDHVYQTTHPVFASFGISTYTTTQISNWLNRHSSKMPISNVTSTSTSGTCMFPNANAPVPVPDTANNPPILDKDDCIIQGGTYRGDAAAGNSVSDTFVALTSADMNNTQFARFDVLKKQYIEVSGEDWINRYAGAMSEAAGLIGKARADVGDGTTETTVTNLLVKLNQEANRSKYRFKASDSDAEKQKKLNIALLFNDIQSSLSGVVTFKSNLAFNLHPECTTFSSGVIFNLHLYDNSVEVRSNKRAVVQRGKPRFAMQPTLAFGAAYAGAIPHNHQPGVYPLPEAGGDSNPDNMVGGELDITYDPNTKQFEAGSKAILARLLTDVAGASLNNVTLENVDDIPHEEMYGPDGNHNMSHFTTGWALPLQMHNNNPYEYGPVFKNVECEDNKKHKIRVVNRAPKSFPKGQIVMCHKLSGGEWIIMDFGAANIDQKSFEFGKWQFWKLIANKDAYRRDDRFHYDPNVVEYHDKILNDSTYEGLFRAKFYQGVDNAMNVMISDTIGTPGVTISRVPIDAANRLPAFAGNPNSLGVMNGGFRQEEAFGLTINVPISVDFVGSRRYQQTTSFDQMSKVAGGTSVNELIGLANPYRGLDGSTIEDVTDIAQAPHSNVYPHWGPILNHGYDVAGITSLGTDSQGNGRIKGYRSGGVDHAGAAAAGGLLNDSDTALANIKKSNNARLATNILSQIDGLGIHVPADVGTNAAPYSENGSPIEDLQELLRCVNVDDKGDPANQNTSNFLLQAGGNGADFMDNDLGKNLALGVREYLSDVADERDSLSAIAGIQPAYWFNASSAAAIQAARGGKKSWRNGERPNQGRWVYVAKDTNAVPTGAKPDSAYNLKPMAANRITFVPLAAEHCGTFDNRSLNSDVIGHRGDSSYGGLLDLGSQNYSLRFSDRADMGDTSLSASDSMVFPRVFVDRCSSFGYSSQYGAGDLGGNRIVYQGGGGAHGDDMASMLLNHLSYGQDAGGNLLLGADGDLVESVDVHSMVNGYNGFGIPYGIYCRHQHEYGDNGQGFAPNDLWSFGNDGLSTVGIASAKCTVKVRGYELAVKTLMSAGISAQIPRGYQRWGSSGDGQMDFGTTAGYVKVYDAWPEEQTIFDPRYFAVMHFNAGQLMTLPGGKFVGDPTQDDSSKMDEYTNMYRWVDNEEFDVDYRVPTVSGNPGDVNLIEIEEGREVFSDFAHSQLAGVAGLIRPKEEWKVVTTRRGMLLPFKYRKKTLCLTSTDTNVASAFGHNLETYDATSGRSSMSNIINHDDGTSSIYSWDAEPSVWIAASGEGYKVGDVFDMTGGGEDITGKVVVTKVNTVEDNIAAEPTQGGGPVGAIIEIRPGDHPTSPSNISFGEGYDAHKFVSFSDYQKILAMNPNDPVSAAPQIQGVAAINPQGQANAGIGAVIYALHGVCSTIDKLDVGPLKQQSAVRFTPASNGKQGRKKLAPYARKLSIARPNKDFAYDVFLQHHNDVSHVFMHSDMNVDHVRQFTDVEIIGV